MYILRYFMSIYRWFFPNIFNKLPDIIECLPVNIKRNYFVYCLCCSRLGLYVPIEIKKLILINFGRSRHLHPKLILRWFDEYITDSVQKTNNPIYLTKKINYFPFYNLFPIFKQIDILYGLYEMKISRTIIVPRHGNLFCGILKNPNIKSINLIVENVLDIEINQEDFFEFEIDKPYEWNYLNPPEKMDYKLVLWIYRDIFPILMSCLHFQNVKLVLNLYDPNAGGTIGLFFGIIRNHFHNLQNFHIKYKRCEYRFSLLDVK